jgi:hypothetical protein
MLSVLAANIIYRIFHTKLFQPEPAKAEHLSGAPPPGQAVGLSTNIRLGWNGKACQGQIIKPPHVSDEEKNVL